MIAWIEHYIPEWLMVTAPIVGILLGLIFGLVGVATAYRESRLNGGRKRLIDRLDITAGMAFVLVFWCTTGAILAAVTAWSFYLWPIATVCVLAVLALLLGGLSYAEYRDEKAMRSIRESIPSKTRGA